MKKDKMKVAIRKCRCENCLEFGWNAWILTRGNESWAIPNDWEKAIRTANAWAVAQ